MRARQSHRLRRLRFSRIHHAGLTENLDRTVDLEIALDNYLLPFFEAVENDITVPDLGSQAHIPLLIGRLGLIEDFNIDNGSLSREQNGCRGYDKRGDWIRNAGIPVGGCRL